jgi:hypothetical protein
MKMRILIERSQSAKRNSRGFSGPDTYLAVLDVPSGAHVPKVLRESTLEKRGIKVLYRGEFYGAYRGPRSRYNAVKEEVLKFF